MAGQGAAFLASGGAWKVDPRLLIAIAGAESSFGQITCAPYNAWGYGCPDGPYSFESWAEAIDTVARGLRTNYLAEGRTSVALIGMKYAPVGAGNDPTGLNNHWSINVSRFLLELGGNPDNVDISGVAGRLPLGLELDPLAPAYDFKAQEDDRAGESELTGAADRAATVTPGEPARLVIRVRNTGSAAWTPQTVRLRRVDASGRVTSAPYAALADGSVAARVAATFVVDVAAAGTHSATVDTVWRLEGPGGPFGAELHRTVRVVVPTLVQGDAHVTAPRSLAPGRRSAVVVKVRNDGSAAWHRDGEDAVLLGVRSATGPSLRDGEWTAPDAPARLLESTVEPGGWGSFAFAVRMPAGATGVATLELRIFDASGWSDGQPVRVSVEAGGAEA